MAATEHTGWPARLRRATRTARERPAELVRALIAVLRSVWVPARHYRPHDVAPPTLRWALDAPEVWKVGTHRVDVSGWALDTAEAVDGVRFVTGGRITEATFGERRSDVAVRHRGVAGAERCGFWASVPVSRGRSRVRVEVRRGGRWVAVGVVTCRAPFICDPVQRRTIDYPTFVRLEEAVRATGLDDRRALISAFAERPLVSVIVPVYDPPAGLLERAVASVQAQCYPHWELWLVDDASPALRGTTLLDDLAAADAERIRVVRRDENGGIASATNDGIEAACGTWCAFLDQDDELTSDALFQIVARVDRVPDADIVYTDQDKIDAEGRRHEPHFKPDWSPELLRGVMYVGHLLAVRRALVLAQGGCDPARDGVQDYDLVVRCSEHARRIEHVPRICYHWRAVAGSVAAAVDAKPQVAARQQAAVQAHLDRTGRAAVAEPVNEQHRVRQRPRPRSDPPLISILIPTRDRADLLGRCLETLYRRSSYPRFEVILGDNETVEPAARRLFDEYPVRVLPLPGEFHFSRFNNLMAAAAHGELLLLLNNDTEIVRPDWLEHLAYHAEQPEVGAVGPLLLYPDDTVQHAGVQLGIRGTADHVMRGFPADVDGYAGSLACNREVSAVTAACLMVRAERFAAVGGFRERFRRHYEDVDLCLRLREQGWQNRYVASTRVIHHESKSRGRTYDYTDRQLLLDRWEGVIRAGDPFSNPNFDPESTDYGLTDPSSAR